MTHQQAMIAVKSHPAFGALLAADCDRKVLRRRPAGRSRLSDNAERCMRLAQEIMRATGATFNQVSGAVLAAV